VSSREEPETSASVIRHEEALHIGTAVGEAGAVRASKRVETERAHQIVPRQIEHFDDLERIAPAEGDSGEVETLADGSVSIPVFEEELVVTTRLVVRERVVIRKRTETEERRVDAELRKERVEIVPEGDVKIATEGSP
jgi:uncharacterized protein (TIGR02271 family)